MNRTLVFKRQHLFVKGEDGLWVYDTGSPISFGTTGIEPLKGNTVEKKDMSIFSDYLGIRVVGLIGTDILNAYDHIIDLRPGQMRLEYSEKQPPCDGMPQTLGYVSLDPGAPATIPTLRASIGNLSGTYIFDTGAQISYLTGDPPSDRVPCTPTDDFWPPIGEFNTETYHAIISLKGYSPSARFGYPPVILQDFLRSKDIAGIIGNELLIGRLTGYFPLSNSLTLQA